MLVCSQPGTPFIHSEVKVCLGVKAEGFGFRGFKAYGVADTGLNSKSRCHHTACKLCCRGRRISGTGSALRSMVPGAMGFRKQL